jgi:hypothetical protein
LIARMPRRLPRPFHALCAVAIAFATVAEALPAAAADARVRKCKSADLRYPFQPGGPKTFGVFRLRIAGGTCTTAHRVSKAWMKEFEANLSTGRVKLPRSVAGFSFTTLPATEAQTYRERGRKGAMTIRFAYRVPNG